MQTMPKRLILEALKHGASIGRDYDSTGKHVAYWLRVSDDWKVYRHSVRGMIVCLRQFADNKRKA